MFHLSYHVLISSTETRKIILATVNLAKCWFSGLSESMLVVALSSIFTYIYCLLPTPPACLHHQYAREEHIHVEESTDGYHV